MTTAPKPQHTPDHVAVAGKMVPMVPDVFATCAPELAAFIDPTGALRAAGLLVVQP